MARRNEEVGTLLQEYADLLAITGGDAHRIRSYEKAARSVAGHPKDVTALAAEQGVAGLQTIPSVGKSIAEKIVTYLQTGTLEQVEKLRAKVPAGVRQLTAIPTLGPKRALILYQELGVASVPELVEAIKAGRLRDLKGFGEASAQNLLHGVELLRQGGGRVSVAVAMQLAEDTVAALSQVPGCERCTYAGSLRRARETVGDLDILAASTDPEPLMETFTRLPGTVEVIARGSTKTSVRTSAGLQVDLRVVAPEAWGAALQYFTGSKQHNVRIRELAVHAGRKLSEYGLFDVESGELIVSRTEEEVYQQLGLPWIPPPLREDRGEVQAARDGTLPHLVQLEDIRGDLHTHTNLTDGTVPLETMVKAAAAHGYAYYAVTDHAPNLVMQRMTLDKARAQREAVRKLDGKHQGMRLLHGSELNIDPDGAVDWPAEILAEFDVCVASVHSHFQQPRDATTRRLLRACENPHVHIIGHPTARKTGRRKGIDADWDAVFAACARTGTALEVNAHPDRLDLPDELILRARHHGVKFAIDSDAHRLRDLDLLRYGIGIAQRGWLTPDDVINTWPLDKLQHFLRKGR
jgi:DNA polymerase (family X)